MDRWYLDTRQHLFGSLDAMLEDSRANVAALPAPSSELEALLSTADRERAEIETLLKDLAARHATLASVVDDIQRALAVAGAPLRGEIS
jgi:hypothetical protein